MAEKEQSTILLQTQDGSKQVELKAFGPKNATIVIPTSKRANPNTDIEIFDFMDAKELEHLIRENIDVNLNIPKPVITAPTEGQNDYTGGITLAPYALPNLSMPKTVTTHYEFSSSSDFSKILFSVVKKGNNVTNLPREDILNKGIAGSATNEYHVRVRVFCNNYVSDFSDPVKFYYSASVFEKPTIYNLKFPHVVIQDTGNPENAKTPAEEPVRATFTNIQPRSVSRQATPLSRSSAFSRTVLSVKTNKVASGPINWDDNSMFYPQNGLFNCVLKQLGEYREIYKDYRNIPTFAFNYKEVLNKMKDLGQPGQTYENEKLRDFNLNRQSVGYVVCNQYKQPNQATIEHQHNLVGSASIDLSQNVLEINFTGINGTEFTASLEKFLLSIPYEYCLIHVANLYTDGLKLNPNDPDSPGIGNVVSEKIPGDFCIFFNRNRPYTESGFVKESLGEKTPFTDFPIYDPTKVMNLNDILKVTFNHRRYDFTTLTIKVAVSLNDSIQNLIWPDDSVEVPDGDGDIIKPPEPPKPLPPDTGEDGNQPEIPQADNSIYYPGYNLENCKFTGDMYLRFSPAISGIGNPGKANILLMSIKDKSGGNETVLELPYDGNASDLKLKFIPFVLWPDIQYDLKIAYKSTETDIVSPWSDVRTFRVPKPRMYSVGLDFSGLNGVKFSDRPTIGIKDLACDYDFLDYVNKDFEHVKVNDTSALTTTLTNIREGKVKYDLDVTVTGDGREILTTSLTKDIQEITDFLYKGFLINTYQSPDNVVLPGTSYKLNLRVQVQDKTGSAIELFEQETETKTVRTPNDGATVVPEDNNTPLVTRKDSAYFGEIFRQDLITTLKYRGLHKNSTAYEVNDEVSYNDELYICIGKHTSSSEQPSGTHFTKVTFENHSTYYKSGLPSYSWLSNQIGLPLFSRTKIMNNGEIKDEVVCSDLLFDDGWIKVSNNTKQILYIAKKPLVSNLSYEELRRRFLVGHSTRTIRIGLFYYNVRLIEVKPNDFFNEVYNPDTSDRVNDEKEINLLELLHNTSTTGLAQYTPVDVGITNDSQFIFTAKGRFNVVYQNSSFSFSKSEVIEEQVEDGGNLTLYRPVLELVKEDHLAYKLSNDLPGDDYLEYDKFSDVGYYGILDSSTLITVPNLLTTLGFNPIEVNALQEDIYYHKVYYHGLVLFLPNKPICNNSELINFLELHKKGCIFGTHVNPNNYIAGRRYSIMALDLDNSLTESSSTLASSTSILGEIISRINSKYSSLTDQNLPLFSKKNRDISIDGSILRNVTKSGKLAELKTFVIDTVDGQLQKQEKLLTDQGKFYPIIVMSAYDNEQDISYKDFVYGTPTISYEEIRYRPIVVKPITTIRYYPEKAYRDKVVDKVIQVAHKEKTGNTYYNNIPRSVKQGKAKDNYGIALSHVSINSPAAQMNTLYGKSELNIDIFNGELTMLFSTGEKPKYKTFGDYICKHVMSSTSGKLVSDVTLIPTTFESGTNCKVYTRSLISDDYTMLSLRNEYPSYPNTSKDHTYPLGILMGYLSSAYCWYPSPKWFNLYNPALGLDERMNVNPAIVGASYQELNSSWKTVKDRDGKVYHVPLLSPYISYGSLTPEGKDLISKYIAYVIIKDKPDIKLEELEVQANLFMQENLFGIIGVDLEELYILDGNGIISGDGFNPTVKNNYGSNYRMSKFLPINSATGESQPKLVDIFNPVEEYNIYYTQETIQEVVKEEYIQLVPKEYTEYVEELGEEVVIRVPKVTYN